MPDGSDRRLESLLSELRRIGPSGSATAIKETFALCARAQGDVETAPRIVCDVAYGPDPEQLLDIYGLNGTAAPLPVLLFVHGGGFVGGGRHVPDTPFYDNVGGWATRGQMLAVTIDYRLAPRCGWPSGADDVAAALDWTHEHIAGYGGDPDRIVLLGHSAGAAHVASFLAGHAGGSRSRPVAAVMLSGLYDITVARHAAEGDQVDQLSAYYGASEDERHSSLQGLLTADLPMMFGVAELDLPLFQAQAATVLAAAFARDSVVPPFAWVSGHSHFSQILTLGLDEPALGTALTRFLHGARNR